MGVGWCGRTLVGCPWDAPEYGFPVEQVVVVHGAEMEEAFVGGLGVAV